MKRSTPRFVSPDLAFFVGLRNGLLYSIPLWAIIVTALYRKEILAWISSNL